MLDLNGSTILLTGGTGSFGNAFVERVLRCWPEATLRIYSRDELKQSEMRTRFGDGQIRYLIGDVRDRSRMTRAVEGADIVVHAAAMKQVPACEYNPFEAVRTNVLGAQHVVDAAIDARVTRVVALSTDKAVNPVNLYGATKLCAEKIFVQGNAYAAQRETRIACVRYGNVVGSRGSVVPVFREQLARDGRITITDERMTRFWITLPQAVDLVLYALDNMDGGEIFIPKIPSMRVTDLAEAIAPGAPTEVVGIRPGEKLHELLITSDEARHAIDAGDVYVVMPEHPWWDEMGPSAVGKACDDDFVYASDTNEEWLSIDALRAVLAAERDRNAMIDIPYGRQTIDDDDIAAVVEVLRGDWLTQGPAVEQFEAALCGVTGAEHAVAFANGTVALHASLWATGVGKGDTVATSPLSFVASASCALWVGAQPAFVDIDPKTLNLDFGNITRCDALVAVHYAGLPLDLAALVHRPRVVIEDAAHALGAHTASGPVGNCASSDACVFSFHPVKTVTTGEGGAVTTNSPELAARLRRFRSHGMDPRPGLGGWYYEISELTPNARITDIQCALGASQLAKLEQFVTRRNELAQQYETLLAGLDVEPAPAPAATADSRHAYHLYPVRVPRRRAVYDAMRASGIGVQVHYVPIYRHPLFAPFGVAPSEYPETERAYDGLLSLPMFPDLTDAEQVRVVETLARDQLELLTQNEPA